METEKSDVIAALESEYPHGVDLYYVDYRENLDCNKEALLEVIKNGYSDEIDQSLWDAEYENTSQYIEKVEEKLGRELTDTEREEVSYWVAEHDTSRPYEDLLRNSSDIVLYVELDDTVDKDYMDGAQLEKEICRVTKKYAKSDAQKRSIRRTISEQFYSAPVSFYFKVSPSDLRKVIVEQSKYVVIDGAHFGTVDRAQGSNWLDDDGNFTITLDRDAFVATLAIDDMKGNGYGWSEIAGVCDDFYSDAGITSSNRVKGKLVAPYESEKSKLERVYHKKWYTTNTCTSGDMNMQRHKKESLEYKNEIPCGTHCADCGTFWID